MWYNSHYNFEQLDNRILNILNNEIGADFPTAIDCFIALVEADTVAELEHSTYKWLTEFLRIVKINESYIRFPYALSHSDQSIYDQGYKLNWEHVKLVEPVEVKAIKYVPIVDL